MADIRIDTHDTRLVAGSYNWLKIGLLGLIVGALVWASAWLLGSYVIDPLVCRSDISACANSMQIAANLGAIIGVIIGAIVLIRLQIRRPILIVLAVLVALWGINSLLSSLFWLEQLAWTSFIYSVSYLLFSCLSRLRNIWLSGTLIVVMVLLVRALAFL